MTSLQRLAHVSARWCSGWWWVASGTLPCAPLETPTPWVPARPCPSALHLHALPHVTLGIYLGGHVLTRAGCLLQNATLTIEEFHARLQEATNFPLRPFVVPFLKVKGAPLTWLLRTLKTPMVPPAPCFTTSHSPGCSMLSTVPASPEPAAGRGSLRRAPGGLMGWLHDGGREQLTGT